MRVSGWLCLTLIGCDVSGIEFAAQGALAVEGSDDCVIDARTSVGYGFCLDGDNAFAVSGDGPCGDVTIWMDPTWAPGPEIANFNLHNDSNDLGTRTATVWVDTGGETYASTSGTASGVLRTDGTVAVSFDASLETFIGGDPGPMATGMVICDLN